MRNNTGVIFLGVCERASYVRDSYTNIPKWNILGLKQTIVAYVYPLNIKSIFIGLAYDINMIRDGVRISICNQDGKEWGSLTLRIDFETNKPSIEDMVLKKEGQMLLLPNKGWLTSFFSIDNDIIIPEPGIYNLMITINEKEEIIGQIIFNIAYPPALTHQRISAIESDPMSSKIITMSIGCKECPSVLKTYAALKPPDKNLEDEGYILYSSIPDRFICKCKETNIDLQLIRKNLHGFLGYSSQKDIDIDFTPLYEKNVLLDIKEKFISLINTDIKEEVLQKFIEENLILLHQFPAEEIFFKPPILTHYKADFGLVTPQKELILIEIEKNTTKLLKKNGDIHSDLNHSFDQVNKWLHTVDEHRIAALESMKIDYKKVSNVRGVVIAGRESGYDAEHIRKLKGYDKGKITFLTYDDILFSLNLLIREIENL